MRKIVLQWNDLVVKPQPNITENHKLKKKDQINKDVKEGRYTSMICQELHQKY